MKHRHQQSTLSEVLAFAAELRTRSCELRAAVQDATARYRASRAIWEEKRHQYELLRLGDFSGPTVGPTRPPPIGRPLERIPESRSRSSALLPQPDAAPVGEAVRGHPAAPTGSATILVVEDEPMLRGLIRHVLEASGYVVLEAPDGAAAVDMAAGYPHGIDLVLTDVVMPGGLAGPAVAEKVRQIRPHTRVLFMSGHTEEALGRNGVQQDRVPFLQKPFVPTELAHKVRELLHRPSAP